MNYVCILVRLGKGRSLRRRGLTIDFRGLISPVGLTKQLRALRILLRK